MKAKPLEKAWKWLGNLCFRHFLRIPRLLATALFTVTVTLPAYGLQLDASSGHSLLVRDDGSLWVWGDNFYGQFGDGSTIGRSSPVKTLTSVKATSGGLYHTLALKTDGTLWVWGRNADGQLGTGNTDDRTLPIQITSSVKAIAAGALHSLVLKNDGTLWVTGDNSLGQLGDGGTTNRSALAQIMTGVAAIGSGDYHSLAVKTDGTLWTWGANEGGQLGNNSKTNRNTPVQVATGVRDASGGRYHSLAVKTDNTLWAWGFNGNGQLGNGTLNELLTPTQIISGIQRAQAGGYFSLAHKADGGLWGWGYNGYGALGDGSATDRTTPTLIATSVVTFAAGSRHSLVAKSDGQILATGDNGTGQLGDGSTVNRSLPVYPLTSVQQTSAGGYHTLAVRNDGTLWAWGSNLYGQLGNGGSDSLATPTQIMTGAKSAAAGLRFSLAVKTDGTLWSWGENTYGQLGDGSTSHRSTPSQILTGVQSAAAGGYQAFALKNDGTLWAWGDNNYGQLGNGTTQSRTTPTQVMSGVIAISSGGLFALALKTDGTLWAWGYNADGQIGDNTTTNRSSPVQIMTGVQSASAGWRHALALKSDGSLWAWGSNYQGRLGDGTTTDRRTPIKILESVQYMAAGTGTSVAQKTDKTIWIWGSNSTQIVGPGAANQENSPRRSLFIDNLRNLSIGTWHAAGLTASGAVAVWGNNYGGILGVSTRLRSASFIPVLDPLYLLPGSLMVAEYYNPSIPNGAGKVGVGHYFVTGGPGEQTGIESGAAGPGWSTTGRTFAAWNSVGSAPAGAVGVCRFYAREPNSHFYTGSASECQTLKNMNPTNNPALGWAYEGIAFYSMLPGSAGCSSGYFPVFRSYNNRYGLPTDNDGNHRITPSYNDHWRLTTFYGYIDEGVGFCSPVSSRAGGDLHASYAYPGSSAPSGGPVSATFVYSNNGLGSSDGGKVYASLPTEVSNWTISCTSRGGAACPASTYLTPSELRSGRPISPWPPGGGITITVRGTAPQVTTGNDVTLHFGATVIPQSGYPDSVIANNTPVAAQTVVKAPNVCNYVVSPTAISIAGAAQAPKVTIDVGAGCAWTAQSAVNWIGVSAGAASGQSASGNGTGSLTISVSQNTGTAERSSTLTVAGKQVTVNQAGATAQPAANCAGLKLQRTGDQVSSGWSTGSILLGVTADASCQWQALAQVPWITVISGGSGQGSGTLSYRVDENPGEQLRTGKIAVGSAPHTQSFTVSQFGTSDGPGGADGGGDGGE